MMKKIFLLAASALALAACNNEDINNIPEERVAARISATICQSAATRAADTAWTIGDSIGVSMNDDRQRYVNFKYIAKSTDGRFTGDTLYFKNKREPVNLTAYYPYTGSEGVQAGAIEASTGADVQTQIKQPSIDFLYAQAENMTGGSPEVRFNFSHKMSKLTLIFQNGNNGTDVSKIQSYEIDGLFLKGSFNTADGSCAAKTDVASAPLEIKLTEDDVTSGEPVPSIIVFPQTPANNKLTLTIRDSDNQEYSCELKFGEGGILSGNHYQWTINVNKTDLNVGSASITGWATQYDAISAGSVLSETE